MSRIAERINEIKASQEHDEMREEKKTAITIRVEEFTLFCIEKLRSDIGGSRSAMVLEIVSEGVIDGLEGLGHTMDSLKTEYLEESKKLFLAQKEAKNV